MFTGALASYAVNSILGMGVATGRIDTSKVQWIHHAVFVVTVALSVAAASSVFWSARTRAAGAVILPAAVPFALIPRFNGRSRTHVVIALSAAPFLVSGTVAAWTATGCSVIAGEG